MMTGTNPAKKAEDHMILPLSPRTAAKIASAVTIVHLNDVILGLLRNSFDAAADSIYICVDFEHRCCAVEDNGLGIASQEFGAEGGLGRVASTSKADRRDKYGHHGVFLMSVAAMANLNIKSIILEKGIWCENEMLMQESKFIKRQSSQVHANVKSIQAGTAIAVTNLFQNMPVRIKLQSACREEGPRSNNDDWDALKLLIVSLLLAWHKPVTVVVRLETGGAELRLGTTSASAVSLADQQQKVSFDLLWTSNVLVQAGLIDFAMKLKWIPVTAKNRSISIKGAICLQPFPSKNLQFLSIGIEPLSHTGDCDVLYDHVNRIFSESRFGETDGADADHDVREQNHCGPRSWEHDNAKLIRHHGARKGVDRWPAFCMRIQIRSTQASDGHISMLTRRSRQVLGAIRELLTTTVRCWLTNHHFTSRNPKETFPTAQNQYHHALCSIDALTTDNEPVDRMSGVFNDLTHFRSASLILPGYSSRLSAARIVCLGRASTCSDQDLQKQERIGLESPGKHSEPDMSNIPVLAKSESSLDVVAAEDSDLVQGHVLDAEASVSFENMDSAQNTPVKTGMILNNESQAKQTNVASASSNPNVRLTKPQWSSRRQRTEKSHKPKQRIQALLDGWQNPVFHAAESAMQHISVSVPVAEHRSTKKHPQLIRGDSDLYMTSEACKLTLAGLQNAELIAQIDRKFILAKFDQARDSKATRHTMLVMVDQHAADERCKVEALFAELCGATPHTSVDNSTKAECVTDGVLLRAPINFLVNDAERRLLEKHAQLFGRWGIRYAVKQRSLLPALLDVNGPTWQVTVSALPSGIAERGETEPGLIVELLRSEGWKKHGTDAENEGNAQQTWLRRIGACPRGIVEMLNSRACRSAIMFNDALSRGECEELLRRLAGCAFPFQCAHGRPSMVPVTDLSGVNMGLVSDIGHRTFIEAAKKRWPP